MEKSADVEENRVQRDIENADIKKLRYPQQVFFIIGTEFCDRFMFMGMRTILALYMSRKLSMDNDSATIVYHGCVMLAFSASIFGAFLCDTWLGKFKTILYVSILYAIGGIILAASAIPNTILPPKEMLYIGVLLISFGSGGIKPCVMAFGGDQFKLPEQAVQLTSFFAIFYCAINGGSLVSAALTPILREEVHCFGENDCYSIAFGVPAILTIIAIVMLLVGKPLYTINKPTGNILVEVTSCIMTAVTTKRTKLNRRAHFLDYAIEKHGAELVRDTKVLLRVLVIYLPLPLFWALYDQQGSRWTFQAANMDGDIGVYTIKPDQFNIVNPLLVLLFVPLSNSIIYPIISKIGINTALKRISLGGVLLAVAFAISGFVELELQKSEPILPNNHHAQIRIFNGFPCDYDVRSNISGSERFKLEALHSFQVLQLPLSAREDFDLEFQRIEIGIDRSNELKCPKDFHRYIEASPNVASSLFINGVNQSPQDFYTDQPNRSRTGIPLIRFLLAAQRTRKLVVRNKNRPTELLVNSDTNNKKQFMALAETFEVFIDEQLVGSIALKQGSVTTVIISETGNTSFGMNVIEIVPPNSLNMLWQIPQYIVLSLSEVLFVVNGLEFSYSEAPQRMKSVILACAMLTVAIGNAILMIIVRIKIFESQANEFFLFATLMVVDMCIFMVLARKYNIAQANDSHIDNDRFETDKVDDSSIRNN